MTLTKPPRIEPSEHATYVYLKDAVQAARTKVMDDGLVADYDGDGNLIGLEVLDFGAATLASINRLLSERGYTAIQGSDLRPTPPALPALSSSILEDIGTEVMGLLSETDQESGKLEQVEQEQLLLQAKLRPLAQIPSLSGRLVIGPICQSTPTLDDVQSLTGHGVSRVAVRIPEGLGIVGYWIQDGEDDPLQHGGQNPFLEYKAYAKCSREERISMAPHLATVEALLLDQLKQWRRAG